MINRRRAVLTKTLNIGGWRATQTRTHTERTRRKEERKEVGREERKKDGRESNAQNTPPFSSTIFHHIACGGAGRDEEGGGSHDAFPVCIAISIATISAWTARISANS
jgi:hypothetical protein